MPSSFVMPYGYGLDGAQVLLAQRQLIQQRVDGRNVPGVIPCWAGQWGLIGAEGASSEPPADTALRALREQTGIELADAATSRRYLAFNRALVKLQTADYTPFSVLAIFLTEAALGALAEAARRALDSEQPPQGLLQSVEVVGLAAALQRLGATAKPPNGWRSYLVQNYYGGRPPGQLNTEIDTLAGRLARRAAEDPAMFRLALQPLEVESLPGGKAPKVPQAIEMPATFVDGRPTS